MESALAPVSAAFVDAGYSFYLVGGVVRDLFLESDSCDVDVTTDALPAQIKALLAPFAANLWTQGERFGTIGAHVEGYDIEITTHRADAYDKHSRKPLVQFGDNIQDDVARRDFTINAMALSLPDRTLFDPYGGQKDLEAKVLRTPLSPSVSFVDDPLRLLRAARFISRFDLTVDPQLLSAAKEFASRIEIVSAERVRQEFERLWAQPEAAEGFAFLSSAGLLDELFTPYKALTEPQKQQARQLATAPISASDAALVRRSGFLWLMRNDAASILKRFKYSNRDIKQTRALLAAMNHTTRTGCDAYHVRKTISELGVNLVADLQHLARNLSEVCGVASAEFFALYEELAQSEDMGDFSLPLSGQEIMTLLGIESGPEVGKAVAILQEHRLRSGPLTAEEATALLQGTAVA